MTDTPNHPEKMTESLLEQYKLYVEMADRVSTRRVQMSQLYLSLLSALLGILMFLTENKGIMEFKPITLFLVSLLGLSLCLVWYANLEAYRQLNSGKFRIIHDMEQNLPYPCFKKEWEQLGEGKDAKRYHRLTHVEKWIPFLVAIPYVVLLGYAIYLVLC
jgi:hypothetical protein